MALPGMRTTRLDHLRATALEVGDVLADHPGVSALLVCGSVALGRVDVFSDVDILALCRGSILPLPERQQLLESIGSGWQFDQRNEGSVFGTVDEDGLVGSEHVTVHYQTVSWIEAVMIAVLGGAISTAEMPFRPYTVASLLQRSWVLLDRDGEVDRWRVRSSTFPSLLQRNLLDYFVPSLIEHSLELKRTAERGLGPASFIFFLSSAVDDMNSILFALNGVYDPADRRMDTEIIPHLQYLPRDYVARMRRVLEGPFDPEGARRSAELFEALVGEVLKHAKEVQHHHSCPRE